MLVLGALGSVAAFAWLNYEDQVRELFGWQLPNDYEGDGTDEEVVVTIASGDIGEDIARKLHDAGVTMTFDAFYTLLLEEEPDATFIPGNYGLRAEMSARAAFDALQNPENKITSSLLITEGTVLPDVLQIISDTTGISLEEVTAAAADVTAYGLPSTEVSLEGWLFPATYQLDGSETAQSILQMLVNEMISRLDAAGVALEQRHEVLTKAALVQREAGSTRTTSTRSRACSRTASTRGWNLESDATVAYGTGNLHTVWTTDEERADASNPYNTYANPGLPVGPIGAPGDLAIDAVLHPADGPWFFFVPINLATGETVSPETAEEHEAAVEHAPRLVRRERRERELTANSSLRVTTPDDPQRTRLAVLGSPIAHSKSPTIHRAAFAVLGLDWEYGLAEVTGPALPDYLAGLDAHWRGLSLTMPLKGDVLALLDEHEPLVDVVGGANTVRLGRDCVGAAEHGRARCRAGVPRRRGRPARPGSHPGWRRHRRGRHRRSRSARLCATSPGPSPHTRERRAARRGGGSARGGGRHPSHRARGSRPHRAGCGDQHPAGPRRSRAELSRGGARGARCCSMSPTTRGRAPSRRCGPGRSSRGWTCSSTKPSANSDSGCTATASTYSTSRRGRRGYARRARLNRLASMLRWLTAGESHGPELVAILEGLPAGVPVLPEDIQADLKRRTSGTAGEHGRSSSRTS